MTPLARAVAAMNDEIFRRDGMVAQVRLLAALEVLGPVIVERARELEKIGRRWNDKYPDWPAIRASLTEREP